MELETSERQLLVLLAEEWEETGPPGYLETEVLAQRLDLPVEKTKSVIRSLFVKGLVDTDEIENYAAYLTPEGYDVARSSSR